MYGLDPKGDQSAAALHDIFMKSGTVLGGDDMLDLGDLVFYGSKDRVSHVAVALSPFDLIESGGGDESTTSVEEARRRNARVRIRDLRARKDVVAIVRPHGYPWQASTTNLSSIPQANPEQPPGSSQDS